MISNLLTAFIRNFRISPRTAFIKIYDAFFSYFRNKINKKRDLSSSTYSKKPEWLRAIAQSYYSVPSLKTLNHYKDIILKLSDHYLSHRFCFLGSGWEEVSYKLNSVGLEGFNYSSPKEFKNWEDLINQDINKANVSESLRIAKLIDSKYQPIDWQVDIKSGYRWDAKTWYKNISYANVPGADIKLPWELGRMQHLVYLAYASAITKGKDNPKTSDKYSYEFQNQILDFVATNPPRFGTQWKSSMDVGIRAVNWLVAYDFFNNLGYEFDSKFEDIFAKSIYEHGLHIINNLEWSGGLRANHYLSNIVSLLFIAAYLTISEETTLWLAFALQELINEVDFQFLEDGGNFEASTSYHNFSSEIVFHSTALCIALPEDKLSSLSMYEFKKWNNRQRKLNKYSEQLFKIKDKKHLIFPDKFLSKLYDISIFSYSLTRANGQMSQIGDNDSGKFLKLTPSFEDITRSKAIKYKNLTEYFIKNNIDKFLIENCNDNRNTLAIFAAIIDYESLTKIDNVIEPYYPKFEFEIIRNMLVSANYLKLQVPDGIIENYQNCDRFVADDESEESGILSFAFPDFGLFSNKTYYYQSSIRCGSLGQLGKGGHSHNDQLSFDLCIAGKDFIVDTGTYLYTAFPERRNEFRSTAKQNTLLIPNIEQNKWGNKTSDDLFWINKNCSKAKALQFSDKMFVGEHYAYPSPHKRIVSYDINRIEGIDICNFPGKKQVLFHLSPEVKIENIIDEKLVVLTLDRIIVELSTENSLIYQEDYLYSPSYGTIQKAKKLVLESLENKIKWYLEIITI